MNKYILLVPGLSGLVTDQLFRIPIHNNTDTSIRYISIPTEERDTRPFYRLFLLANSARQLSPNSTGHALFTMAYDSGVFLVIENGKIRGKIPLISYTDGGSAKVTDTIPLSELDINVISKTSSIILQKILLFLLVSVVPVLLLSRYIVLSNFNKILKSLALIPFVGLLSLNSVFAIFEVIYLHSLIILKSVL